MYKLHLRGSENNQSLFFLTLSIINFTLSIINSSKDSPPLFTHFSQRYFHFAKQSWIASFEIAIYVWDEFALMYQ